MAIPPCKGGTIVSPFQGEKRFSVSLPRAALALALGFDIWPLQGLGQCPSLIACRYGSAAFSVNGQTKPLYDHSRNRSTCLFELFGSSARPKSKDLRPFPGILQFLEDWLRMNVDRHSRQVAKFFP
jgi:hypothetical protein